MATVEPKIVKITIINAPSKIMRYCLVLDFKKVVVVILKGPVVPVYGGTV